MGQKRFTVDFDYRFHLPLIRDKLNLIEKNLSESNQFYSKNNLFFKHSSAKMMHFSILRARLELLDHDSITEPEKIIAAKTLLEDYQLNYSNIHRNFFSKVFNEVLSLFGSSIVTQTEKTIDKLVKNF